ncbi:hypothetical protein AMATHDRAFT_44654 [Amanita thiersii Skay4041]|uniref:CBF1-interacting co-repressor CIR N-terminal domain-containing protein n=1 Tax=Amanita thiersii Skay4041 TaxID=703135 RepID=A0A2A9P115_9AGAR|nr:hypothetical protein AMATHDRAFT_44654 [Amanita thiersii Skay4041]
MGGGDLNMKKSWHPLLLKNQERVWLEEKKALEEKKKLEQLRKEKEEERQLQELQRLQEEQTGKKRTEKLEWMYATPATGTSQNPNDLEDYLLGKKRVDKILTADDNAKVSPSSNVTYLSLRHPLQLGAAHKNFIAVQNANNARDIASKIREDPLLAIKQQEQAAYQSLLSNPLRLKELQDRNGIKPKKDKKEKKREKEERKRRKHERKHHKDGDHHSSSPTERRDRRYDSPSDHEYHQNARSRSPDYSRRRFIDYRDHLPYRRPRSRSPASYSRYNDKSSNPSRYLRPSEYRHAMAQNWSDETDDGAFARGRSRSRSRSPRYEKRPRSRNSSYDRWNNGRGKRARESPPLQPTVRSRTQEFSRSALPTADDRATRLAAMTSNATAMSAERQERLTVLLEKEKGELEAEERARAKSNGMGGFLSQEQKKVFGGIGGLEERIRRGRSGLVVEAD